MDNKQAVSLAHAAASSEAPATGASLADLGLEVVDNREAQIVVGRPVRHIHLSEMV